MGFGEFLYKINGKKVVTWFFCHIDYDLSKRPADPFYRKNHTLKRKKGPKKSPLAVLNPSKWASHQLSVLTAGLVFLAGLLGLVFSTESSGSVMFSSKISNSSWESS